MADYAGGSVGKTRQYGKPSRLVSLGSIDLAAERGRRENRNAVTTDGTITEALPNAMFGVKLDNGDSVRGDLGGRMREHCTFVPPTSGGGGAFPIRFDGRPQHAPLGAARTAKHY